MVISNVSTKDVTDVTEQPVIIEIWKRQCFSSVNGLPKELNEIFPLLLSYLNCFKNGIAIIYFIKFTRDFMKSIAL